MSDYTSLPAGLPIPEDDGAADHLEGRDLPALELPSSTGRALNLAGLGTGRLVVYVYPRTGVPGESLPEGWDDIPGARGCTPQSCAYRDAYPQFEELGVPVVGISAQDARSQAEFAQRQQIPYPLLSDSGLVLAKALGLPTFRAGGLTLYKRLTFVAEAGMVAKVFYPVFPPDQDAAEVLSWLRMRLTPG